MSITNFDKPNTSTPQTELNIGSDFNLLVGGLYRLIIGSAGTGGMTNASKVSVGETWGTITSTWRSELRTWEAASQLLSNVGYPWYQESIYIGADIEWKTYADYRLTTQSFIANGGTISSCEFYLRREGTASGDVYAVIYAHGGVFGTSSVGEGVALATSDPIDFMSLGTDYSSVPFTFSGVNNISLTGGEAYCIGYTFDGGDVNNCVGTLVSPWQLHSGNIAELEITDVWNTYSAWDLPFKLHYTNGITNINKP